MCLFTKFIILDQFSFTFHIKGYHWRNQQLNKIDQYRSALCVEGECVTTLMEGDGWIGEEESENVEC